MEGQTAIAVPEGPAKLAPCRWCGAPSMGTVEIEPARMGTVRGQRVLKRPALEVAACREHLAIPGRQEAKCSCGYRDPDPKCRARIHNA